MSKPSKEDTSKLEVHPDAWARFERAVDVVAKSPPQHRVKTGAQRKTKPKAKKRRRKD
jgi:hypothetical protein